MSHAIFFNPQKLVFAKINQLKVALEFIAWPTEKDLLLFSSKTIFSLTLKD